MPFKRGTSGNPGGRPKEVAEVRDLAREHTAMAIDTLVAIAGDVEVEPRARVAAAVALLDRGYGRPSQEVAIKGDGMPQSITMQVVGPRRPESEPKQ